MQRNFASAAHPLHANENDSPQPLRRALKPSDAYPVAELGALLGNGVEAAAEMVGAPLEMCANSALANAALAVQGRANVAKPWGEGKAGPISLFLLTVAESGDRKTTVDQLLGGDAIAAHEERLEADYQRERETYENEKEGYDLARRSAKDRASKEGSAAAIAEALRSIGSPPAEPLQPTLTFGDPTIEGLHRHFGSGQPSAGLFSSEGGAFVGGVGMSKENALKSAAQFSELWDGAPIKRLRAGDGMTVLRGRRLSLHLMMQPGAAHGWLSDPVLRDQGLFSRLLVASPKSLAGTRLHREVSDAARASLNVYKQRLELLLDAPLPMNPDKRGELEPRSIAMTADARLLFNQFTDGVERQMGDDGGLVPVKGLAAKIGDHAVRIAAVVGLFETPDLPAIDRPLMARGIKLAQWYLGEALRLTEAEAFPPDLLNAEKVLVWLQGLQSDLFSLPCVYVFGPSAVRTKDTARRAIDLLISHRWIEHVEGRHRVTGPDGKTHVRTEVYRLRGVE